MQRWEEIAYARQDGIAEGRTEGFVEGRLDGIAEGRSEGEERLLIKMICKKLQKGRTPDIIAEELEEESEKIRRICETAAEYAPDYDNEKIYRVLHETEAEADETSQA